MKKVFLTAAIILGGLTTYSIQAQVVTQEEEVVNVVQEEYKEIKAESLPQVVKDALAADYPTATLKKAYINDKEEYKLDITVDEVLLAVYVDKEGNWIEKE